jgi:gamma-glutamyl-gamma-aminobutyrate hydrolase PuuD
MNKKLFIVGGGSGYVNWIKPLGFDITNNLNECDLAFFTGGEDVCPELYGHTKHPTTYYNYERDLKEKRVFDFCIENKIFMWGCCRGAQLLCALQPNGYLIQHVKHPFLHKGIVAETKEELILTSLHHQMVGIDKINHKVLVYSENLSPFHYLGDGSNVECVREPELVYYPDILAVGSQPHVEMQFNDNNTESSRTVKFHQEVLLKLLDKNL